MSGSEARDVLLGRLFGYGALVRAGVLAPSDAAPERAEVAEMVALLGNKKSFMSEGAAPDPQPSRP